MGNYIKRAAVPSYGRVRPNDSTISIGHGIRVVAWGSCSEIACSIDRAFTQDGNVRLSTPGVYRAEGSVSYLIAQGGMASMQFALISDSSQRPAL